jgi:uncharacterized membrane protein YqjE
MERLSMGQATARAERERLASRLSTVRIATVGGVLGLVICLAVAVVALVDRSWPLASAAFATAALLVVLLAAAVWLGRRARALLEILDSRRGAVRS